jgi:hypothetical protein
MVWLLGIAFVLGVLYVWLAGHWFGRVVAFLAFLVPFGLVGFMIGVTLQQNAHPNPEAFPIFGIFTMLLGAYAAWPVSGLPAWYRQRTMDSGAGFAASTRPGATATFHAQYVAGQREPPRLLQKHF